MKNLIKEYLIAKDLYHISDDILLNEIEFNIELLEECKADIRLNGHKEDITRDPDKEPFFQKNRSVDVYQQALKNIQTLYRQLSQSPAERHKMKLELKAQLDAFDEAFQK